MLFATAAGRRTNSAYPEFVDKYGYDATVFATQALPQLPKLATVSSATAMVSPLKRAAAVRLHAPDQYRQLQLRCVGSTSR